MNIDLIKQISKELSSQEQEDLTVINKINEDYQYIIQHLSNPKSSILKENRIGLMLDRIEMNLSNNKNTPKSDNAFKVLAALEAVRQGRIKGPHVKDVLDHSADKSPEQVMSELLKNSPNVVNAVDRFAEKLKKDSLNNGRAAGKLITKLKNSLMSRDEDAFKNARVSK